MSDVGIRVKRGGRKCADLVRARRSALGEPFRIDHLAMDVRTAAGKAFLNTGWRFRSRPPYTLYTVSYTEAQTFLGRW